jgi:hypothetical protein
MNIYTKLISLVEGLVRSFVGETLGGNPESPWVRNPPYQRQYPRGGMEDTTSLSLVNCRFDSCRGYKILNIKETLQK